MAGGSMSLIQSSDPLQDGKEEISIPEDLMIDIFLRVSAISIFQFRALSKYHRELFESDEFTRMHYEKSKKTGLCIILHGMIRLECDRPDNKPVVIKLDFESGCKVDEFIPPFKDEGHDLSFLGCQRGILCYSINVGMNVFQLVFWNPTTRIARYSRRVNTDNGHHCVRYFFGYDVVTDDFKILKIARFSINLQYEYDCVIYSSKADSWTRTGGFDHFRNDDEEMLDLNIGRGYWRGAEVLVEDTNCVHMLAYFGVSRKILAYDFTTQKFKLVPLPKICTTNCFNLSSVDGYLCLLMSKPNHHDNLEGWIMKEHGIQESWAILFSIKPDFIPSSLLHPRSIGLVVIKGRPQLLITSNLGSELYLYDIHRKQFTYAQSDLDDVHKQYLIHVLMKHPLPQHFLFVPSHRHP